MPCDEGQEEKETERHGGDPEFHQNISVEQPFLLEDKSGQIHIEFNFKHCGAIKDPAITYIRYVPATLALQNK